MSETAGVPNPQKPETWNESTARLINKRLETIRKIVAEIDSGTKSSAYIADAEITLSKLFESIEELQKARMENVREKEIESDVGISAREVEKLLRRVRKGEMKQEEARSILSNDPKWFILYSTSPRSTEGVENKSQEGRRDAYPSIKGSNLPGKAFYYLLACGANSEDKAVSLEELSREIYGTKHSDDISYNSRPYNTMTRLKDALDAHSGVPFSLVSIPSGTNDRKHNRYWLKKR